MKRENEIVESAKVKGFSVVEVVQIKHRPTKVYGRKRAEGFSSEQWIATDQKLTVTQGIEESWRYEGIRQGTGRGTQHETEKVQIFEEFEAKAKASKATFSKRGTLDGSDPFSMMKATKLASHHGIWQEAKSMKPGDMSFLIDNRGETKISTECKIYSISTVLP